jgi:tRNA-dihydrouridine synthase B
VTERNKEIPKLAPMAGYTDAPFRSICREMGADWGVTEMVSADGIVATYPRLKRWIKENKLSHMEAGKKLARADVPKGLGAYPTAKIMDSERPVSIQLFGNEPEKIAKAAEILMKMYTPDGIDINMGCPAKKVYGHGRGSALLADPKLVLRIIKAVRMPVDKFNNAKNAEVLFSVKTRLGIEDENELQEYVQDIFKAGVDFMVVHARTYKDYFSGDVRINALAKVVEKAKKVDGRVIANGNVTDVKSAKHMLSETEAHGVAIARGAVGNPWIFKSIAEGKDYAPTVPDRVNTARKHAEIVWEYEAEQGIVELRKHLGAYFKGLPGIKKYRMKLVTVETLEDVNGILSEISEKYF